MSDWCLNLSCSNWTTDVSSQICFTHSYPILMTGNSNCWSNLYKLSFPYRKSISNPSANLFTLPSKNTSSLSMCYCTHWYYPGQRSHHYCHYYLTGFFLLILPSDTLFSSQNFLEDVRFFHSTPPMDFCFARVRKSKSLQSLLYKVLHNLPHPHSSLDSLFTFPQLILLQPHWLSCRSSNKAGMLPPQGLCTSNFFCLECFSLKYPHGAKWSSNP